MPHNTSGNIALYCKAQKEQGTTQEATHTGSSATQKKETQQQDPWQQPTRQKYMLVAACLQSWHQQTQLGL